MATQKYSIISELNEKREIKHSYKGKVNTNADVQSPIMKPFEEYSNSLCYTKTHKEHERLLTDSKLRISKIETIITEELK